MKSILCLTVLFCLTACSTYRIQGDINTDYAVRDIAETTFPPSNSELTTGRSSVLVMKTTIEAPLAKRANLHKMVSGDIEVLLQKSKIHLIDRSKATLLNKELKLAEVQGKTLYQGEKVADFVMIPHITGATFYREFTEAVRVQEKDKKPYFYPARCDFTAHVTGYIEVYKMPELTPFDRIPLSSREGASTETRSSSCHYSLNDTHALIAKATKSAIARKQSTIKNLVPPKGHILEMRINKKGNVIMKTTLGSNRGAKPNLRVFFKQKRIENLGGSNKVVVHDTVGEGVISDKVYGPYSWVVVDPKKSALSRLLIGDTVTIQYKQSLIEWVDSNLLLAP